MNGVKTMRTWALAVVVAVAALAGLACNLKERGSPTQPEARNLDVPETTVVVAAFSFEKSQDASDDEDVARSKIVLFFDESEGNIDSWLWDFGDGTTSRARNPVHEYKSFGLFVVTLTVSNSISTDSATQFVVIDDPDDTGEEEDAAEPAEG